MMLKYCLTSGTSVNIKHCQIFKVLMQFSCHYQPKLASTTISATYRAHIHPHMHNIHKQISASGFNLLQLPQLAAGSCIINTVTSASQQYIKNLYSAFILARLTLPPLFTLVVAWTFTALLFLPMTVSGVLSTWLGCQGHHINRH